MELPITRPSQVSYADELIFSELIEKMAENHHNGFIRITHSSEEGYILFKDGEKVAASYDRFLKSEAIDQIESAFEKSDTLIEVFDLKESQMDYLLDLNKVYKLEEKPPEPVSPPPRVEPEVIVGSEPLFNPKEASYRKSAELLREEMELQYTQEENVPEVEMDETISKEVPAKKEQVLETETVEVEPTETPETRIDDQLTKEVSVSEEIVDQETSVSQTPVSDKIVEDVPAEVEIEVETEPEVISEELKPQIEDIADESEDLTESEIQDTIIESSEVPENEPLSEVVEEEPEIPMDRLDLMKKYGLRDIDEDEVENILDTYKGGSISSDDVEKIELTLMNKIKKSIMGIPKISGTEVMVFLESSPELMGKIKIITLYEGKGLLSRIRGDSKDVQNLKYQITDIAEMEIRKSFREYPQIVDNFDIDIEVHSP